MAAVAWRTHLAEAGRGAAGRAKRRTRPPVSRVRRPSPRPRDRPRSRLRGQSVSPPRGGSSWCPLERGASGTPVAAEAVADGPGGATVAVDEMVRAARAPRSRRRRRLSRRPRPSSSRPPGDPEPAWPPPARSVEPDVLPTAAGATRGSNEDVHAAGTGRPEHARSKSRRHASPKTTKLYDRTADTADRRRDRTHRDLNEDEGASPIRACVANLRLRHRLIPPTQETQTMTRNARP